MYFPAPYFVQSNGIPIAVYDQGAGPAIVLLHGFPELAYSWRRMLEPLTAAGYRTIVPDLRGYGRTGCHGEIADYRLSNLALDVIGILDALSIDQAIVAGHDFGGALAWTLARNHPGRCEAVISLNTPYTRRGSADLLTTIERTLGPDNYMVTFQAPGVAEELLLGNIEQIFRSSFRRPCDTVDAAAADPRLRALPATLFLDDAPHRGETFVSEDEIAIYVDAFRTTGFSGALNWYRNFALNREEVSPENDRVLQSALMISAEHDIFLPPSTADGIERQVPNVERRTIAGCGHWTPQERPEETARLILDWLARRGTSSSAHQPLGNDQAIRP